MKQILQKSYYAFFLMFMMLASIGCWGQTTLLSEQLTSGSLPSGWMQTNVTFTTYARFTALNSVLSTPVFDASAYTSVDVDLAVAKYGSGTDGPITVEYSLNSGINWVNGGNSSTPTSSNYLTSTVSIAATSSTMQIRYTRASSPSEKRLKDLVIKGISSVNISPTATPTYSGTMNIGSTLTGVSGYADADSDAEGTSTFQWYRADNDSGLNSAAISGATATTYTLQAADDGKYIRFGVVPVAQTGTSPGQEAFSSWQGPVANNSIAAPQANAATGVGATSFTANWDAVAGATSYEIDVYKSTTILASDLFISEYVEGTSNNKYIEIFNGTGTDVDLSDYDLVQYNGGSTTPTSPLSLSGTLTNGSVYVIRNNSATIWTGTSNLSTGSTVMGYNGNDVIALRKQSLNIDVVGTIGNSAVFAANATLRRNSNLSSPATSYNVSDWTVLPSDTVDGLGSHTFDGGSSISYILQNQDVGNVTSYQVTGLDQNTTYYYVVRAIDATSESVNSNEITTTTAIVSTTWNGTAWSNSAPTASVDAIIDGDLPTTTDLACKDLTINSGKTLTIAAGTTLTVSGNLVNNGSIIFESNNTSTGRFDSYTGAAIAGSGTVTMERYIDGKRAFRFLAPGVTTTSTIANNWQQQVFITGSTTVANAGGFDVTETGAPSMFTFEDSGWAAIANTGLTLNAQKGYRILIRGDRTPSILTSPSNGTMNTPVTLTATGTMVTGDVPYTTLPNQDYTLVANPYISPINWATVTKSNISDTYYAWDPNLGTGNQRGRYVSCDVAGNTSIISGTGSPSTDVDQFIQPGQAVFIQKTTSGVNGSVTIKETDKAATFTDVFRTPNNSSNAINGKLGVNLYESLAYSIGEYPIDGAVVVSGTTFNTNSASDDTKKIMSHGEQVAFVRDNIQLGVEKISAPQENDELSIACVNLVPNKNYVWSVVLQDEFSNEDTYLYDAFTQIYHPIQQNSVISFSTNDNVNSTLTNRFKIVFQTSALSADDFVKNIKLYPNPAKAGGSFYIDGITEATISVYNVVGQNIPVTVMSQGNAIQVTPSASLSNGVYLVSITTQGITKQVKWIVE